MELLIVVAILALIITIAVMALFDRPEEVREGVADYNIKVIQGAVDVFYVDNGYFPDKLEDLYDVEKGGPYLRTPKDEITKDGVAYNFNTETGEVTLEDND